MSTAKRRSNFVRFLVGFFGLQLAGCIAVTPPEDTRSAEAQVKILKLSRNEASPFRFWGEARILAPQKYRDKIVPCFFLSHERDLTSLVDRIVTIHTTVQRLNYDLDYVDPFTIGDDPHLNAEFRQGQFQDIDEARYVRERQVTAHIIRYEAAGNDAPMFFVYDMLYSGDLVTIEVESPMAYHGTRLRILIEDPKIVSPLWSKVGAQLKFAVPESTLAWEPWGFSFVRDLKELAIGETTSEQR